MDSPVIEHPESALISLRPIPRPQQQTVGQVSPQQDHGHLRCHWAIPFHPDTWLKLEICTGQACAHAIARVHSCDLDEAGYLIELRLLDAEEAFHIRMIEQLCHICRYRDDTRRREGRVLDLDEAAAEWIARYAEQFPGNAVNPR